MMVKPSLSRKRLRTQAALIDATLAIIAEEGFEALSLNSVAARAGVTKGSIYSNFRCKGELLWAASARKRIYVDPKIRRGGSTRSHAKAIARALMPLMPRAEKEAGFHRQLEIYSRSDPELRALMATEWKALFARITQRLKAEMGDKISMRSHLLSFGVQALIRGFMAQWAETPGEVTEEVVAANFEALLTGATTPRQK
jgi:AcrR family transcriptional regulator